MTVVPPPVRPGPKKWTAIIGLLVAVGVVLGLGVGSWLSALERQETIKRVSHADPALQAAVRRAQGELDTFVTELRNPKPGERFAVKGAFPTPAGPEYLWVRDPEYANGVFTGILDQAPIAYSAAQKGDKVTVVRKDVFDWLIKDGDQTRGGYTERALAP